MFSKILIANRGEIALRIIRACRELGIKSVAVHSAADTDSMHVRMADESVCIGPAPVAKSYLSIPSIIAACEITNADAIHPGYGFLSENPDFAEILREHRIAFIGPSPEHIRMMGDKIAAKEAMRTLGIPCLPGSAGGVDSASHAREFAAEFGFPLIFKASAGGGGRGMKVAQCADELEAAFAAARNEARSAFGDGTVYLEKYLANPRHIEIQIFGDGKGGAVHLGERDCSLQRRYQKLFEEAPSPVIDEDARLRIGRICAEAVAEIQYSGAGTIEFLYENGDFHFIEMNTRIQVEHPVTEAIYGVDLVREQIQIAAGMSLSLKQEELKIRGHAIEVRVNAESLPDFVPCPGTVSTYHAPGGLGVRMDSALYSGYKIPPNYDGLVAKLIVHGHDRNVALARLGRALDEMIVDGIETTIPLFRALLGQADLVAGNYDINWLTDWVNRFDQPLR